jgi:hemerythrin-like domain-containing protein
MSSDTRQLLDELREDHRNMSLVLNILDSIATSAQSGEDPDFELIDEIMRYMTVYPDAVHHPKEDLIYTELQTSRPDLATDLEDMPAEHRRIALLGNQLRDEVAAIVAGAAVRRESFVKDTSEYVQQLRDHMQWEEEELFPRVDEIIGANNLPVDVERYQHIKDPVFELEVESGFRRLVTSLQSS